MRCPLLLRGVALAALLVSAIEAWATPTVTNVDATITVIGAITLSPNPLAFGNEQVGTSSSKTITLKNNAATALPIAVSLTQAAGFSLSNDCGNSIAVGASCQVAVSYSPSAETPSSATLTVNASGHIYTATISGTGTAQPPAATPVSIALSPSSIQILDTATGGSIVSVVTVTCSDGTTSCAYTLSTSDTQLYQINGNSIVLSHSLTSADDGSHPTTITAQ